MKLSIKQDALQGAVDAVSALVERTKNPMPVLNNILLEAEAGFLVLKGTDMESQVSARIPAKVEKPGRTTVVADKFRDIVRELPADGDVTLLEEARQVRVLAPGSDFKLLTIPAEDFPQWNQDTDKAASFNYAQVDMEKLLDAVMYALPSKEHRRILLGVHFELVDCSLRLTATDAKKMCQVTAPVPEVSGPASVSTTLPRRLLENVVRHLKGVGSVDVCLGPRQSSFRIGHLLYEANALDGVYPDMSKTVPVETPIRLVINRDAFSAAAKRAGITADNQNKTFMLRLELGEATFISATSDLGMYSGVLPIQYDGPMIELMFNYQAFMETLARINTPDVRVAIRNARSNVAFRPVGDDSRLHILAPVVHKDALAAQPQPAQETYR